MSNRVPTDVELGDKFLEAHALDGIPYRRTSHPTVNLPTSVNPAKIEDEFRKQDQALQAARAQEQTDGS